MIASGSTGPDAVWPSEPRARSLAQQWAADLGDRPLVSVHNGLPARYLAEDLPITDPIGLVISHDQGVQALLRSSGIRTEFTLTDGWRAEDDSRRAFVLLWEHLVDMWARPWVQFDDETDGSGLAAFRDNRDAEAVYDAVAARLAERPARPRGVLAAANLARLGTSDDPSDDLRAHRLLADDPELAGRVVPTFSPDRYLDPGRRGWPTDADLLAEVTGIGTDDLDGFLAALQERRAFFRAHGAVAAEHHSSDVPVARLSATEASGLFRLARSAELLAPEALALQGHLLWESARMSADDRLVMRLFPPAGVAPASDRGIGERVRPLLTDVGSAPGFRLQLFSIDTDTYVDEIVPVAAAHSSVAAVPPTRFVDDPALLRAVRVAGIGAQGVSRTLGVVDDMSGPFVLAARHRLGRRLDAGALAELVVGGRLDAEAGYAELAAAVSRTD